MATTEQKLTRIGVFYDGNFFFHVSNYYQYYHTRRSRISVAGLHNFVRQKVAENESSDVRYCQIVDAHYFRGRVSAKEAQNRGDLLLKERIFDDVLVREGVTTHYLPLGPEGEKGIDVWLALEAYEMAIYKRFDVTVIVACDSDFLPLVRKLNTLGTRVMLLGWDFRYLDQSGQERETRTSQVLLEEVTYPLMMQQIIDDRSLRSDPAINNLFMPPREYQPRTVVMSSENGDGSETLEPPVEAGPQRGTIQGLKEGYGFITPSNGGRNLFFYHAEIMEIDFTDLVVGDEVEYELGENERGVCAINIRVIR